MQIKTLEFNLFHEAFCKMNLHYQDEAQTYLWNKINFKSYCF